MNVPQMIFSVSRASLTQTTCSCIGTYEKHANDEECVIDVP